MSSRRENIIALGNSGTGKSRIGPGLGLAACQRGLSVGFTTAAALVHELIEARDQKRLLRLRQYAGYKLLIVDELGYVHRRRAVVRGLQPTIRTGFNHRNQQSTFRRMASVFGSE